MRLKLDENLGRRIERLFAEAGHEVSTVHDEELCAASDAEVIAAAAREDRCLVTLDLEFGNPLIYRAADYRGIAVLRVPSGSAADHIERVARTLVGELKPSIARHLWIVEIGRIRIYEDPDEDPLEPGEFDR